MFLHHELLPLARQSLAERRAVLGDRYQTILNDLRTMMNNPDEYRLQRLRSQRPFRERLSTYQSIQDDHYEFLPMIEDPYEAPLRRTQSEPYAVFSIPENKGNEDVDINAATVGTQTCGAEVHFNNKSTDEDFGPIPGFCFADVNFDAENIEDDFALSSKIMPVPDKWNREDGLKDKNTDQVIEFCIAELNFSNTQTNETDDLEQTELGPYQDGASIKEVYEKLQSSTRSDTEQDEASTNEVYEKLQSSTGSDTERDEASTNETYEKLQSSTGPDTERDEASTNKVYEKLQPSTGSDAGRDEASTNKVYEKLQSSTGSDSGRDEASTNGIYEKIQKNPDVADVTDSDDSNEYPTQVR
jgi:hypothetical protein